MPNEKKWAFRKIRKGGRVKIGGVWWKPWEHHLKYDGRLDGLDYLFARYDNWNGKHLPFLNLWGTKEFAQDNREDSPHWPGPHCVDGGFVWEWWEPVKPESLNPVKYDISRLRQHLPALP